MPFCWETPKLCSKLEKRDCVSPQQSTNANGVGPIRGVTDAGDGPKESGPSDPKSAVFSNIPQMRCDKKLDGWWCNRGEYFHWLARALAVVMVCTTLAATWCQSNAQCIQRNFLMRVSDFSSWCRNWQRSMNSPHHSVIMFWQIDSTIRDANTPLGSNNWVGAGQPYPPQTDANFLQPCC